MKINISLPFNLEPAANGLTDIENLSKIGAALEDAGVHAGLVTDHPCPGEEWLNAGGYSAPGPLVMLSMLAAVTTRLRLQTSILVLPYRNPFIVARDVSTLDRYSNGRFILGVGAGYLEEEFRALGANFDLRNDTMDDHLRALQRALTGEAFSHEGHGYSASNNRITPPPKQTQLPIFIGGNSRRAIRRAAQFGQGWNPFFTGTSGYAASTTRTTTIGTEQHLRDGLSHMRECCDKIGREYLPEVELGGVTSPLENISYTELLDRLGRYSDLGISAGSIVVGGRSQAEWCDGVAEIGQEVIRHL